MARDDERGRHEPEDRPRGSNGERVRGQQEGAEGPGEQRDEVDTQEARRADRRLEQGAEDEQHVHVERDMQDPGVQEPRGDDPPPVAVGDGRPEQRRMIDHRASDRAEPRVRTRCQLGEEGGDVDRDQRVRGGRRPGPEARRDAPHLGAIAGAFRAPHADGRDGHAVRTDRSPAVGARDVRLAVGMAIADGHGAGIYLGLAGSPREAGALRPQWRLAWSTGSDVGCRLPPRGSTVTSTAFAPSSGPGIAASPLRSRRSVNRLDGSIVRPRCTQVSYT